MVYNDCTDSSRQKLNMKKSTQSILVFLVIVLALGVTVWILYDKYTDPMIKDIGITGGNFPRVTIDADGTVGKDLPLLSTAAIAQLPDKFFKILIFGINPVIIDNQGAGSTDLEKVVFSVDNKPTDIFKEYKEYFTAIGWTFYESENSLSIVARTKFVQISVDIAAQSPSGSLVVVSRKQLK